MGLAHGMSLLLGLACWMAPLAASAQACCAGASAVTPGRLALHENALAGLELRAAALIGSYDSAAAYHASPPGIDEWDFEQDLLASLRVLQRGQLSLLVPFIESWRRAPTTGAELGGGIGDVNASARYDFTWAREYSYLPGIALLLGVTLPTGRAPESAHLPLGSDATGVGALQATVGLSLERAFAHWLAGVTGLVAKRLPRHVRGVESELGTQLMLLASAGYVFETEAALAAALTLTTEGRATVDGASLPGTARRFVRVALAGTLPLGDFMRLQATAYLDPPVNVMGKNQPATTGLTATWLWSFL
jgi:hypothetical protein